MAVQVTPGTSQTLTSDFGVAGCRIPTTLKP